MSSDDADDECESPSPAALPWVDPRSIRFTVFVVLPSEEVRTLRDLPSGITLLEIKDKLELEAGLPSQIYSVTYPDGEELLPDQKLVVKENILHGYVLKLRILETWVSLYKAVYHNQIEQVYHSGGVHLKGNIVISPDEAGRYEGVVRERGAVALYMAAYMGMQRMVSMLLSVGVDPNSTTIFGRTPLHAAVAKDMVVIMDHLVDKGAVIHRPDCHGDSPLKIAQKMNAVLCFRRIRLMQLNLRGNSCVAGKKGQNRAKSYTKESFWAHSSTSTAVNKSDVSKHAIRKQLSKSAPSLEVRKSNPRSARDVRTNSSLSNATTGKIKRGYNVKWSDTAFQHPHTRVTEAKVDDVVKVQPVTLALPKTIVKFSTVQNSAKDEKAEKVTKETPLKASDSGKEESKDITRAMKFTKERLNYFSKMSKPEREYVPMAEREKRKKPTLESSKEVTEAFKKWLERKEEEEEIAHESEDEEQVQDFNESDSEADRFYDFNKKVRKMNRNNSAKSLTPGNRPIMTIMQFASTTEGDGTNPPPEYHMRAYSEWRTKRRGFMEHLPRMRTSKDLELEKRRLEEKRQKLLMNAISYEEWMDHTEERKFLIRQILKADLDEIRKLEEAKHHDRQKMYSYDLWKEKLKSREQEDRKRKEFQKMYDKERLRERDEQRSAKAVSFDVWLRKSRNSMSKEKESEQRLRVNGHLHVTSKHDLESVYNETENVREIDVKASSEPSSFTESRTRIIST
ncbi:serine/threonine-protein kinase dst2-like [Dreissena polymorpha]|uniref:Uncharacterized protein n=1 Tax=Dreissena polymorpha TaxID=45954 RepID=A0A9D4ERY1_DREPO|nr:serine/threonine-protein kinase dst2-like [Dreissena polymorpha]KAH3784634.1 hypothetical protein DPMN_162597 [Dreissena polymorpha]